MRIDPIQARQAIDIIRNRFGDDAAVRLFGSRADDARRGGDVDLYVEVPHPVALTDEARCRAELADLFDLDVDLVVNDGRQDDPIPRIAARTGVPLVP
jgi:predicted nucleotidyltransferase